MGNNTSESNLGCADEKEKCCPGWPKQISLIFSDNSRYFEDEKNVNRR